MYTYRAFFYFLEMNTAKLLHKYSKNLESTHFKPEYATVMHNIRNYVQAYGKRA